MSDIDEQFREAVQNPTAYGEFWIWCQKFSVPLGVATLK